MIKYSLICGGCDAEVDGWFPSSEEFDKQKKKGQVVCLCATAHTLPKR